MKLERKDRKNNSVATKLTSSEKKKLDALSKKEGISKSNLIYQMIKNGYESLTNESF